MSCIKDITQDITYSCGFKAIQGLEKKALLVNRAHIDFSAIVRNANGTVITALPLLAGKTAYIVDDIKNLNTVSSEFVSGDSDNGHKHSFLARFHNLDENALANINALTNGAELVVITETKFKGNAQKSAFKIFGLDLGMKMSEGKYSSNENKATYTFTLSSEDGYEEPKPFYFWLETDYSTTKKKYDRKLTPPAPKTP